MKKSILASLALAGLAFCGCTQDEVLMSEADEANERAQIQALAEEYGLEVKFDETARLARSAAEPLNMDSVEAEMKAFASLAGEYTCLAQRGDTAIFGKPRTTTSPIKRLTRGGSEGQSGSFLDWINGPYGDILIEVRWSRVPNQIPTVSIELLSGMLAGVGISDIKVTGFGPSYISFSGRLTYLNYKGYECSMYLSGSCSGNVGHVSVGEWA